MRNLASGLFTLLVRSLIGAIFLTKMKETISNSASKAREPFLRAFAIAGSCFFFVLPLLAFLLFLFAHNSSLARNLTLIAGLSQVCVACPVLRFVACCCSRVRCSCWVWLASGSSCGPKRTTRTSLWTKKAATPMMACRLAFESTAL